MAFSILAFVSKRGTLKKSWRNKGECVACMSMVSWWCVAVRHSFAM
jgi:hypothetical protein